MKVKATPWNLLGLIGRQLFRNRRRTLLTFVGLVISFFLYTSLESVLYTLTRVVSSTARETVLFVRPRDRLLFWRPDLPERYVLQVRETPAVVAASPLVFFFGQGREEGSFAVAVGVEAEDYMRIRRPNGVSDGELKRFQAERTAGLVGDRMLERNDWKVGETVTLRGAGRTPSLSFEVVGDIDAEDRLGGGALVHAAYVQDVLHAEGRSTFIEALVSDAVLAPAVARAIDDHFENFTVPTETITEKAHVATVLGSLSEALGALRAIGYLTLAVTVLVVGNNVAMSIRERTVEIGTFRALGFSRAHIMALVLGEAVLVALPGAVLGAATAYGLFESGVIRIPSETNFVLKTDWSLVLRAALLSLPVGALAGLQPAWSAVRMAITDALRYAD